MNSNVSTKKLCLLAYRFPPRGGVGSRRWVIFCKYLVRLGWTIHIVTPETTSADEANWGFLIESSSGIVVHQVSMNAPQTQKKKSPWAFIRSTRSAKSPDRSARDAGELIDDAEPWIPSLVAATVPLLRNEGIMLLSATGPPFSVNYAAAIVKHELPHVHLVEDYRDSWNDQHYHSLSEGRLTLPQKERSLWMQGLVQQAADTVLVVGAAMERRQSQLYPNIRERVHVIPNGFDPEQYGRQVSQGSTNSYKGVYLGTLAHPGLVDTMLRIGTILSSYPEDTLRSLFHVDVYSPHYRRIREKAHNVSDIDQYYAFNEPISPVEVPALLSSYSFGLSICPRGEEERIGTKVLEYLGAGLIVMHISEPGEFPDYLRSKGHVTCIHDPEDIKRGLNQLFQRLSQGTEAPQNYPAFNARTIAEKLDTILTSASKKHSPGIS